MKPQQAKELITRILDDIEDPNGAARTDDFLGLRQVDAKVREASMVIESLPGFGKRLARDMEADPDFEKNSRRVRLEALAGYCRSALRLLRVGAMSSTGKKKLLKAPKDLAKLTAIIPDLHDVIHDRWYEAQKCQHAQAYFAAVILIGSILEGLLLARAQMAPADAYRATAAPKTKGGESRPLHNWTLSSLIDVSAELGWIRSDRKSFSHALRDSRNTVHPWHHVRINASFDRSTYVLCWETLRASVRDLVASLP